MHYDLFKKNIHVYWITIIKKNTYMYKIVVLMISG